MARRRGRGEGAIYQRADGIWVASFNVGYDEKGKRKRRIVYGKTKREAQEKLLRLQSDTLAGVAIEPNRLTVAAFLSRWLEDSVRTSVRASTFRSYSGVVRLHINPRLGGVTMANLSPAMIQGMYASMERDGVSPRLRQLCHAVLHRALSQAVKWGLAVRNACEAVDKPRVAKHTIKPLTSEQVGKLLDVAKEDRYFALYLVAVTTGLRQGEIFALRWQDVDLRAGTLSVQHTLLYVNGKPVLGEPKTQKGRRNVQLPKIAAGALRDHRSRMQAEGHAADWVFCDTVGSPLRQSNLTARSFKPLLKKAELPDIRFHDLRHTAATLLLQQGVHPKIVQERLGHAQISLTLDTYSHVLPSMQRDAARKLDELFGDIS